MSHEGERGGAAESGALAKMCNLSRLLLAADLSADNRGYKSALANGAGGASAGCGERRPRSRDGVTRNGRTAGAPERAAHCSNEPATHPLSAAASNVLRHERYSAQICYAWSQVECTAKAKAISDRAGAPHDLLSLRLSGGALFGPGPPTMAEMEVLLRPYRRPTLY